MSKHENERKRTFLLITIPILALTANDFEEDIRQTREAGMNDHLTKPFDMEKIFGALAAYAGK